MNKKNPIAKELRTPKYQSRVIENKKKKLEDDEHYVEYRADLGLALSFLKNRLSLNDWSKIKKPKTKSLNTCSSTADKLPRHCLTFFSSSSHTQSTNVEPVPL